MKIKLFTLRLIQNELGDDQKQLNDFFEKHQVLQIETAYVGVGDTLWSVAVFYELSPQKAESSKNVLSAALGGLSNFDLAVFEALKTWRSDVSKRFNIAPYRIASNRELQALAVVRPKDLIELERIKGFGKIKVATFGSLILEQLSLLSES